MDFFKDVLASVLPASRRERLCSPHAAFVSGLLELVIFASLEWIQFRKHFVALAEYFAPYNTGTQTAGLLLLVVSEFFYPLSLFFILLAFEGFCRAVSAAILGDVSSSLFVGLVLRLWTGLRRYAPAR